MSISQFTDALKNKSSKTLTAEAQALLDSFVKESTAAFAAGSIRKKASIITEESKAFRTAGEKQGRTRLILTEDDLNDMFSDLNISSTSKPIALYLKFLSDNFGTKLARHYEIYLRDGTIIEKSRSSIKDIIDNLDTDNIIAVRGLNFSHENTLIHVAHFLHSLKVFPGKSRKEIEDILAGEYDRGHIYAQTYGRAVVSLGSLAEQENILSQIAGLYGLLDEGSTSLKRLDGKYNELLVRAKKDFTGKRLAMNIQLQLKRNIEGTGNRDTGDLSSYIRIVGFLQKLIKNSKLSADGKRQLGIPAATSLKEFEKALTNLNTKLTKYKDEIDRVLKNTSDPEYLVRLQTSDDILTYLGKSVGQAISGNKVSNLKVVTPNISVFKTEPLKTKVSINTSKIISQVSSIKSQIKNTKKALQNKKTVKTVSTTKKYISTNLTNLQNLINQSLVERVKANMGRGERHDVLNLRTGRFAESVKVERMSQSREGMITAFYSYMKNPYATFSEGGRQQSPKTRDPKLLIAKSIREIASQQVANRLRSVVI